MPVNHYEWYGTIPITRAEVAARYDGNGKRLINMRQVSLLKSMCSELREDPVGLINRECDLNIDTIESIHDGEMMVSVIKKIKKLLGE